MCHHYLGVMHVKFFHSSTMPRLPSVTGGDAHHNRSLSVFGGIIADQAWWVSDAVTTNTIHWTPAVCLTQLVTASGGGGACAAGVVVVVVVIDGGVTATAGGTGVGLWGETLRLIRQLGYHQFTQYIHPPSDTNKRTTGTVENILKHLNKENNFTQDTWLCQQMKIFTTSPWIKRKQTQAHQNTHTHTIMHTHARTHALMSLSLHTRYRLTVDASRNKP